MPVAGFGHGAITVLVSSEEAILRVAVDVSPRVRFGNGNRQTQETRQSPGRPFPARVRTRRLPNMGGQAPVLLRPADFDLAQCAYSHAPAEWREISLDGTAALGCTHLEQAKYFSRTVVAFATSMRSPFCRGARRALEVGPRLRGMPQRTSLLPQPLQERARRRQRRGDAPVDALAGAGAAARGRARRSAATTPLPPPRRACPARAARAGRPGRRGRGLHALEVPRSSRARRVPGVRRCATPPPRRIWSPCRPPTPRRRRRAPAGRRGPGRARPRRGRETLGLSFACLRAEAVPVKTAARGWRKWCCAAKAAAGGRNFVKGHRGAGVDARQEPRRERPHPVAAARRRASDLRAGAAGAACSRGPSTQ